MKNAPFPVKKVLVSIAFGIVGFYINFHAIHFSQFANFKVSILGGLLFPLLISLAWGWRYGLIAALAGGCQSMWWLWHSDGYGILYAVPVFTLWILWHGIWSDYRRSHENIRWYHSMYAVELPFRACIELGFFTLFRWLVSLNPPPWAPETTWTHVSYNWVGFVAIKHTVTAYILLLLSHVLLNLGPVRRFFGLVRKPDQRNTTYIVSASVLLGLLVWFIDAVVVYSAFFQGNVGLLEFLALDIAPRDLFIRNLVLIICLISGLLISKFLAQRFEREDALRQSEALLRQSQEMAHVGTWRLDLRTNDLYWSDEVYRIFGLRPDQFGASYEAFLNAVHPDDREMVNQAYTRSVEEQTPYDIVHRVRRPDGTVRIVHEKSEDIRDESGQTILSVGMVLDVTERVLAERELTREKDALTLERGQLLSIFDSVDEVIYVADPQTYEILFANRSVREAFNKELVGGICYRELQNLDAPCDFCTNEIILEEKGKPYTWEYHNPLLNQDFLITDRIIRWSDGRDVRFELAVNITGQKSAEAELRSLNKELEMRVSQRTAQLEETNQELEDFVYSVSHDLRAPLRSISGFAEIIERRHKASLNEEGQHYFENIIKASRQMGNLIDDLLQFSRLGRNAMKSETVPLDGVFRTAIETLSSQIKETNARIDLPEQIPVIQGDVTLTTHIFINLLDNAIKYHKPDEPPVIHVSFETEDPYVVVFVADNGIGIEPEYQEKIFNIFQRLHSQADYPGTGIGLSAVKKAVQIMGGRVWLESEPDKGSVFKTSLLRAAEPS